MKENNFLHSPFTTHRLTFTLMLLFIVLAVLIVVFISTRYGVRSASKPVRVLSYTGVFLSIALMVYLVTISIIEKLTAH